MRIGREEIFGPVLSIMPYKDEGEAIAIANDTFSDWAQSPVFRSGAGTADRRAYPCPMG